jgi:hypothetical protein
MFTRLSKREARLAITTAIIVVVAVTYRFVLHPQVERLHSLKHQAAELDLQYAEMERNLALGDRIETLYREYESLILQEGSDLQEIIKFLRTLDTITNANKMVVSDYRHLPIEPSRYSKVYSLRIGVKTRPVWLARFLLALGSQKELLRVEDIVITALDDSENLAVDMKLTKVVASEKETL